MTNASEERIDATAPLETAETPAESRAQLVRLERLTDVIFAVVIWRLFVQVPGLEDSSTGAFSRYFVEHGMTLVGTMVGIAIAIIYWLQSNTTLGALARTDARHTALSILAIFALLCFLQATGDGIELGGSPVTRAFESATALALGLFVFAAWRHAAHGRRLLSREISDERVEEISRRIRAEPLTAAITLPCVLIGPAAWELSWFVYPLAVAVVRRMPTRSRLFGSG